LDGNPFNRAKRIDAGGPCIMRKESGTTSGTKRKGHLRKKGKKKRDLQEKKEIPTLQSH